MGNTNQHRKLLAEHGHRTENGRWWFSSPKHPHSEEAALRVVEACVLLDMPITDVMTSAMWVAAIRKVAKTEENLQSLQSSHDKIAVTVLELETKLEHYRLYGFPRYAEDE